MNRVGSAGLPGILELRDLAVRVARDTAQMVHGRLGDTHSVDTKSSINDLVTDVDRAAEAMIVSMILGARPQDSLVGEEGTGVSGSTDVEWIIDPIDGTTSFWYGLPGFSVSIAARVAGELAVGCVVAPAIGNEYAAATGHGATLNGRAVRCRTTTSLAQSLLATGFSPDHDRRARQARQLAELLPRVRDIRRMGSAALDLCLVAAGQAEGYFEVGLNEWDYAAGAVIAAQAGATTVVEPDDATGRAFIVAAAPGIADDLVALLRRLGADKV